MSRNEYKEPWLYKMLRFKKKKMLEGSVLNKAFMLLHLWSGNIVEEEVESL